MYPNYDYHGNGDFTGIEQLIEIKMELPKQPTDAELQEMYMFCTKEDLIKMLIDLRKLVHAYLTDMERLREAVKDSTKEVPQLKESPNYEMYIRAAFRNNSDCYADTWDDKHQKEGAVIPAMTEEGVIKLFQIISKDLGI